MSSMLLDYHKNASHHVHDLKYNHSKNDAQLTQINIIAQYVHSYL